jgi:hypothetical protein
MKSKHSSASKQAAMKRLMIKQRELIASVDSVLEERKLLEIESKKLYEDNEIVQKYVANEISIRKHNEHYLKLAVELKHVTAAILKI